MLLPVLIRRSRALAGMSILIILHGCASTPGRDQPLGHVVSTAFSPDGRIIAAATSNGEVALFDARPLLFRRLLTREADKAPVKRSYLQGIEAFYRPLPLAFSPDGSLLAAGHVSGSVVVWDIASGMEKHRSAAGGQIVDLIFSSDGQTLISAGPDLLLRSIKDRENTIKVELAPDAKATATAMSPDGSVLVVGLSTGEIAIFDATSLLLLRISKVHKAPVTGLAFQRQGGVFASTAGGYDLQLWKRNQEDGFAKAESPVAAATSATEKFGQAQGAGLLLWLLATARGFQIVGGPTLGAPPIVGGTESKFAKAAQTIPFHCGSRVAFSADGRYLLSSANLMMCPDCIGTLAPAFLLFLTNLETRETTTVRDLGCEFSISPDGRTFTTGGPNAPQIRDIVTGQQLPRN